MTIAACAVTGEGVVLGADSTSTVTTTTLSTGETSQRYLNNEQKLFEVGEKGTLGIVTWGLGRIGGSSYRTKIAELAEELRAAPERTVSEAAASFARMMWSLYDGALRAEIDKHKAIIADTNAKPDSIEKAKGALASAAVGFCIAGRHGKSFEPAAFQVVLDAGLTGAPVPKPTPPLSFWGSDLFIHRVLGLDGDGLADKLLKSGKWSGDEPELRGYFERVRTPIMLNMPLRETLDVVHAMLQMTIKVMKFTTLPLICGGHIELATITTDRQFRWVRHKRLAAALEHP